MADYTPYDVCGPLPTGTTLLEASAGTGKTYTIAALATRLVAEGHAELSQLMLVTFSRAATRELRERVREALLDAHRRLADPAAVRADADGVVRLLASADDAEVGARRDRLRRALAAFDAATIATIHGFADRMLAELGIATDHDPAAQLEEQVMLLADEVASDLYMRRYARLDGPPAIDFRCARNTVRAAVGDRHAVLRPCDADDGSEAHVRVAIARDARGEVERRKRAGHRFDYDDLLTRLRDALADPATGPVAQLRVRDRYRYVLVDEFQDTDPVQWDIVRLAFHGHTTLVLIGDPKQSIYAFRGADVFAYLAAAADADAHHTLARNWRSDDDLVRALDHFFGGAALGDERIVVRPVDAQHTERRLHRAPAAEPLRLRVIRRRCFGVAETDAPAIDPVRDFVARDVAADIAGLLSSEPSLRLDGPPRPVTAGDIAVLVRNHHQADQVQAALTGVGVPAVLTGARSVFLTPQARDWLVFLRALEQPHRGGLVRAAALTPFVGWEAARLADGSDDDVDTLALRMREWRDLLADRGVAALLESVSASQRLGQRLLSQPHGERALTDLRHIGQTLHAAMSRGDLGASGLVEWLQGQIADAADDQSEERSQRLETDERAVQVLTIHTSKGLQFPIVYVPFGWDLFPRRNPDPLRFHDDDDERVLYVGGTRGPGYAPAAARHKAEEAGEELRLLYVALTRAQCQVVTWWAATKRNTQISPVHRVLFGRQFDGVTLAEKPAVLADDDILRQLRQWAAGSNGRVGVEEVDGARSASWSPPVDGTPAMAARTWDRTLDTLWRRTSYSGLTASAKDGGAGTGGAASEPEPEERQDEPPVPAAETDAGAAVAGDEAALRAVASPMAELPVGAAFGTMVHSVFEAVDTGNADLGAELQLRCAEVLATRMTQPTTAAALAAALLPVMRTPLGPLAGGRALADIATGDRLSELAFELPLVGGDRPTAAATTLSTLAGLLRRHLPDGGPLAAYPDLLDAPALRSQVLRGYLTGSIDAVLRVRDGGDAPRYLVVDYKTNWLGGFGPDGPEPLTAWDYRPDSLATAMLHAHYPLQALLYSVALHRYLRWRQPAYDPEQHLGGVLYLFVRGMCGPATPVVDGVPTGVFSWRPPAGLVTDLSTLLDAGAAP